ncbi:MAG: hypothetical protein N4A49_03830 [Marinifilaceae bacterium]|jgi:hypothetical protein|nr:hypothetical protein [Marinifilaceae bacterium]
MKLEQRIEAFVKLGAEFIAILELLESSNNEPKSVFGSISTQTFINNIYEENKWFDKNSVTNSFKANSKLLEADKLSNWIKGYDFSCISDPKNILVIAAGNIPMVVFHDVLSVLISGNNLILKLSSKDKILIKLIRNILIDIDSNFESKFIIIENIDSLKCDIDAVIATGSNNSSRYFMQMFAEKPKIIRQNRNSISIIEKDISNDNLQNLYKDIFMYYGLGCRSISKLYIHSSIKIENIALQLKDEYKLLDNKYYRDNYIYQKSKNKLFSKDYYDNGFALFVESEELNSSVSVVNYEYYNDICELYKFINSASDMIQCVVSNDFIGFGESQNPKLDDYADNINSLKFLEKL